MNEFLTLDKIESGMYVLEKSPSSIVLLVKDVMKEFTIDASAKEIDMVLLIDDYIDEHSAIDVDIIKISLVVRNFISNAIKFTPVQGGVEVEIRMILVDKVCNGLEKGCNTLEKGYNTLDKGDKSDEASNGDRDSFRARLGRPDKTVNNTIHSTNTDETSHRVFNMDRLSSRKECHAVITLRYNGAGLSPKNVNKLFREGIAEFKTKRQIL